MTFCPTNAGTTPKRAGNGTRSLDCKSVLEIGCGNGLFLRKLQNELQIRAIGLDSTASIVDQCRRENLEVYDGQVEHFATTYGSLVDHVDCAVAFHCIEHVVAPLAFVRAFH